MKFYDFTLTSLQGRPYSFQQLAGHVVLIVNTARKCGFTAQLHDLQWLHEKYQEQGLVVLGFPSNSFLFQEPGDSETIQCAYEADFQIDFPLMEKSSMLPGSMNPVFAWLTSEPGHESVHGLIKWNFTKFLIDRHGQPRERFGPNTSPRDMVPAIAALLGESAPQR